MFELKPLKKPPTQNKPPAKVASAFKNAMNDDDDNKPTTAARPKFSSFVTAIPQTTNQKILDETSKIMLEDPSIFSYDEHYDNIRDKRKELEQVKKQQNVGSKYIDNLKKASEKRKVEQSIVYEKIAGKELQREGGPGTGEKYVTASYKRMMEENKKFAEEDAAKEAYNKEHAASIEDNTSGMYKDLYKQDIFMGGYRPDIATMMKEPQKPAPQPQQEKKPEEAPQNKPQPQAQPQPQPQPEKRDIRSQEKPQEKPQEEKPQPEPKEAKRERRGSRERSRSREKSPSKLQEIREEAKEQKEPEKELTKEEKLKLMKERYMQRKLNQSGAPAPANP